MALLPKGLWFSLLRSRGKLAEPYPGSATKGPLVFVFPAAEQGKTKGCCFAAGKLAEPYPGRGIQSSKKTEYKGLRYSSDSRITKPKRFAPLLNKASASLSTKNG
jgi:hypothetical protein